MFSYTKIVCIRNFCYGLWLMFCCLFRRIIVHFFLLNSNTSIAVTKGLIVGPYWTPTIFELVQLNSCIFLFLFSWLIELTFNAKRWLLYVFLHFIFLFVLLLFYFRWKRNMLLLLLLLFVKLFFLLLVSYLFTLFCNSHRIFFSRSNVLIDSLELVLLPLQNSLNQKRVLFLNIISWLYFLLFFISFFLCVCLRVRGVVVVVGFVVKFHIHSYWLLIILVFSIFFLSSL